MDRRNPGLDKNAAKNERNVNPEVATNPMNKGMSATSRGILENKNIFREFLEENIIKEYLCEPLI